MFIGDKEGVLQRMSPRVRCLLGVGLVSYYPTCSLSAGLPLPEEATRNLQLSDLSFSFIVHYRLQGDSVRGCYRSWT